MSPQRSQSPTLPMVDLESHQQPPLPSPPPSANYNPETLQPHTPPSPPLSSTFSIEMLQPPFPTNQPESSQQQSQPLPPTPTTPSYPKQPESTLAAVQQHLQWKNSVLSFCFSYAIAVSLQYAQTDHHQPNSSLVLLSFLVQLTFNLFLLALFIRPNSAKTSEILEKVGFLVAAASFCHATAIPFSFELKCAVFAVFLLFLLLVTTFTYFNRKIA